MGSAKWMVRLAPLALLLIASCVAESPAFNGEGMDIGVSDGKLIGGDNEARNVRVIKTSENVKIKPKASPFRVNFSPRPGATARPVATPTPRATATPTPTAT